MRRSDYSKPTLEKLDVHVIDSCNLYCHGCNHLTNYNYGGPFTVDDLVSWITPWKDRVYIKRISLLGGEPLLNPHLKEICIAYRKFFPSKETKLTVITNGILVQKCPWLEELIKEQNVHVMVSLHVTAGKTKNERLISQAKEGLALLGKWSENALPVPDANWAPYMDVKEKPNFQVFYQGAGKNIRPFDENDIVQSKKYCTCNTIQLYKSNLYKCAPIAYIGEALKKLGIQHRPEWQPYLTYEPLEPSCSVEELHSFLENQPDPEWICGMCPPFSNVLSSKDRKILEQPGQ